MKGSVKKYGPPEKFGPFLFVKFGPPLQISVSLSCAHLATYSAVNRQHLKAYYHLFQQIIITIIVSALLPYSEFFLKHFSLSSGR